MATPLASSWYRQAFHANPSALLLLDKDLRVVDVNAAYLATTGHAAEELLGRVVFEPFPDNPDRPDLRGETAVRESMLRARDTGTTDRLVGRRYDITVDGADRFETCYWNLTTVPLRAETGTGTGTNPRAGSDSHDDTGGGEVVLLLHRVQDVTSVLAAEASEAAAAEANDVLLERVAAAQADLLVRAQELQGLNDRLRRAGHHDRSVAQTLQNAMLPRLPTSTDSNWPAGTSPPPPTTRSAATGTTRSSTPTAAPPSSSATSWVTTSTPPPP